MALDIGLLPKLTSKSSPKTACAMTAPIGYCAAIRFNVSVASGFNLSERTFNSGLSNTTPERDTVKRSKRTPY